MRADESLANSVVTSVESDILDRQYNSFYYDIGFVNIEIKYHLESQCKKVLLPIKFIF